MNYKKIDTAVDNFFQQADGGTVYATPGTDNHSANFYGDTYICELDSDDVFNCISCAVDSWDISIDEAIAVVLGDLQYGRPESE